MFCPSCGQKIKDGSVFCSHCGTSIQSETPAASTQEASAASASPEAPAPTSGVSASSAASAAARAAGLSVPAKIGMVAAGAALVGVMAAFGASRLLGPSTQASAPSEGEAPAVVSSDGTQIQALERPLFVALDAEPLHIEPQVPDYEIAPDLSNITNLDSVYLDDAARSLIAQYGFAVSPYADAEFHELYEHNRYDLVPNFVTVDSMMHAYHLYFSYLLKNLERTELSGEMRTLSQEMLARSQEHYQALKGSEWESAAKRNLAFFAVGASLLDSTTSVPAEVAPEVQAELAKIMDASSTASSEVMTTSDDYLEDYSQYKPRGYYDTDPQLQSYFRAMMWFGRLNFTQETQSQDDDLDRSACLMSMALTGDALESWQKVYAITAFFVGASDDCGYYEYRPLVEAVYGADASVENLIGDEAAWQRYHELTKQMPTPQINSLIFMDDDADADRQSEGKGFRFMGQRFTVDASIMQKLIYNQVGENPSGGTRMLPSGLDVAAALGSDEALAILESQGDTAYAGYSEHMENLREGYAKAPDSLWKASLYAQWLRTLNPLLEEKGAGYPLFMRNQQWNRKNLMSYLGSYTELKHDTILYAKQVTAEMGGGPLEERDDRGYVEPEPEVFRRLAELTQATSAGLDGYGMLSASDREELAILATLATELQKIATKELTGEALSDADYELIRTYGGQLEHFWYEVNLPESPDGNVSVFDFPAAIVADVATDPNGRVLELGTDTATIYVVFPIDGELHIASGICFKYYEFDWPQADRLTDLSWRSLIGRSYGGGAPNTAEKPKLPSWTDGFMVPARY